MFWSRADPITMKLFPGFYKYRAALIVPPLLLVLVWPWTELAGRTVFWVAGLAIFTVGVLGRVWAQQHLRLRLKVPVTLTRDGPYAIVRNPIYISNTLICVGLATISGSLIPVVLTLLWCAVLYSFVVREEEKSMGQYGADCVTYFRNVRRWLPRYRRTPLRLRNEYLARSVWAEAHNLLFLPPFVIKELLNMYR